MTGSVSSRASVASRGICTPPARIRSRSCGNGEQHIRNGAIVLHAHVPRVYPRKPLADALHRRYERHREATRAASNLHRCIFIALSLCSARVRGVGVRCEDGDRSREAAQAVATRQEDRADRGAESGLGRLERLSLECRSLDSALRAPLGMTTAVIPSERSSRVIPSERSESRDLHPRRRYRPRFVQITMAPHPLPMISAGIGIPARYSSIAPMMKAGVSLIS